MVGRTTEPDATRRRLRRRCCVPVRCLTSSCWPGRRERPAPMGVAPDVTCLGDASLVRAPGSPRGGAGRVQRWAAAVGRGLVGRRGWDRRPGCPHPRARRRLGRQRLRARGLRLRRHVRDEAGPWGHDAPHELVLLHPRPPRGGRHRRPHRARGRRRVAASARPADAGRDRVQRRAPGRSVREASVRCALGDPGPGPRSRTPRASAPWYRTGSSSWAPRRRAAASRSPSGSKARRRPSAP